MADHYIALNRGQGGFMETDFVEGVASSPSAGIELRIADAAGWQRNDVVFALKALTRRIEMVGLSTSLPNASV